jgi:ligand-binding sensor domain-containing protein
VVNDLLETREGEYWVATFGGLVKFNPNGIPSKHAEPTKESESASSPPMFMVATPATNGRYSNFINTLIQLRDGSIWCGTRVGVFRVVKRNLLLSLSMLACPENLPNKTTLTRC